MESRGYRRGVGQLTMRIKRWIHRALVLLLGTYPLTPLFASLIVGYACACEEGGIISLRCGEDPEEEASIVCF